MRAKQNDWHWEDGRLAAKQLFDALERIGIDPAECVFRNWFEGRQRAFVMRHILRGGHVIALGRRVSDSLIEAGIQHIPMIHPAARGSIRRKENYAAHVKETFATAGLIRL